MDFPMFSYVFLCFSMFFDVFLADFPMDLARKRSPARREGPELGECAWKRAGNSTRVSITGTPNSWLVYLCLFNSMKLL